MSRNNCNTISSDFSFTALAESYIDFHLGNVEDLEPSKETREALCEKRLSEGWFLYALIEIKTRYLIAGNKYENFPE